MSKQDEVLTQRILSVYKTFPECLESDAALVFRVCLTYGMSAGASAETSLTLPKTYKILKVAKQIREVHHGRRLQA